MFYHKMIISDDGLYITTQVNGVDMSSVKDTLSKILYAPIVGIGSVRYREGFLLFLRVHSEHDDLNSKNVTKITLK